MEVTFAELVVWLIIGLLAGSLAGFAVKRTKEGFGRYANLGVGLVGALIGGFLFDLLRIDFGLAEPVNAKRMILAPPCMGRNPRRLESEA